jgi:iron complex transport system substrate-binding protein
MKRTVTFFIFLFFLIVNCLGQVKAYPNRIVSLSPSITEILYELGLGDRIVGVTDYCDFPEDTKNKVRVGGYLNTNYEAVILLKPDLVITPIDYNMEIEYVLDKAGIGHMTVDTLTLEGILNSIEKIGQRTGMIHKAKELVSRLRYELNRLRKNAKGRPSKRVMIVVGRENGSFENLYIAGRKTFYNELLDILGCENVYTRSDISYPSLSLEGILRLNPDVIIEMAPGCSDEKKSKIIAEWDIFKDVNAVKNNNIYVFTEDYVCIPGPRFIFILQRMEDVLTRPSYSTN